MDELQAGYTLDPEPLSTLRIRRGRRLRDGAAIVLKLPRGTSAADIARVRHEHSLLHALESANVAHALDLVRLEYGIGLVLEDAGRRSYDTFVTPGGVPLAQFLRLARLAARALETVHAQGILHKDIKPEHFFCNEQHSQTVLVDFDIATRIREEELEAGSLDALEGTLQYMSPEQTGRMNRKVDRRSDLYSFGVVLYQLLTGSLPFETTDPLELVHCHIARVPRAPAELANASPTVSAIVMRLLEKAAEHRYQSATSLLADLSRCEEHLSRSGTIEAFALGEHDHSNELRIPQKLYGREADAQRLTQALERATGSSAELVLIQGAAGIGKTALVFELHKALGFAGNFVSGKFDQYNRSVPYSALARATGDLVRAELTSSAERLSQWRSDVLRAVGQNGRILLDIVPELALLIGPQPAVPVLGGIESRNRFEGVFQRFVEVSASAERPLIVFLDDLQWADAASLRLVQSLLQNPEQRHLLVVGSYRGSEVGPLHPLTDLREALSKSREILELELEPLSEEQIEELLADTFPKRAHPLKPLAQLVLAKTLGNPFFVAQFLDAAHRDHHLRYDAEQNVWTWELEAVAGACVTANVVDLVLLKLQRLTVETQNTVKIAACVGHRFDARTLATISKHDLRTVNESLRQAVDEGFVVPLDKNYRLASHIDGAVSEAEVAYRFSHDRVQQAAYALIPEAERGPIHLSIGAQLLARAGDGGPSDEALFEVVGALNLGRTHMASPAERLRLAALDVRAARRAKSASAPATACELAEIALGLLGEDPFHTDEVLAQAAHVIRAECSHLVGQDERALESIEQLKQRGRSLLDRVDAANLHALVLTHQGRLLEATAVSLETFRWLGLSLPEPTDKASIGQAIGREFGAYQAGLGGRSVESLADMPEMAQAEKLALLRTIFAAIPAAFQSNTDLMVLMVLVAVQQPLEHGISPLSAYFYAQYAIVHALATGDHDTAYRFSRLGIGLSDHPERKAYLPAVCFLFGGFVSHWKRPFVECLALLRQGIQTALEVGDQMHGAYCISTTTAYRLYAGEPLEHIEADLGGYLQTLRANNDVLNVAFVTMNEQTIRCLNGKAARLEGFDREAEFEATAPPPIAAMYGAHKAMLRYLGGKPAEALEATERFSPLPAMLYNAEYSLYRALALLELAHEAGEEERAALLDRVTPELERYAGWASSCPENFGHRYTLLLAERDALTGRVESAMSLYDRAIDEATARNEPNYIALANELCARFHSRAGRIKVARAYLMEARYQYEQWGATAKAALLTLAHPELDLTLSFASRADTNSTTTTLRKTTTGSHADGGLDLMSAMRATQAIASELVLDRLVERVLRILLENAGAQQGSLILCEPDGLRLIAALSVDPNRAEVGLTEPLQTSTRVPRSIVQYVARSREPVVLDDASVAQRFARDEYVRDRATRSVLCMPLLHQGELSAILYLENAAVAGAFTTMRVQRLQFLGSHAAVAIENAKLYGQVQAATLRLEEANDTLEHKVQERTLELEGRNLDMQRVLDNVTQGLIGVDLDGLMGSERSAIVERWFGAPAPGSDFSAYIAATDPKFADWFAATYPMVKDDVLPLDVALSQLPKQLVNGAREYHVSYLPVNIEARLSGVLIAIDDVSDAVQLARAEADQKEQLALFRRLEHDRSATLGFFDEGSRIVGVMQAAGDDTVLLKRMVHTLKGNAAMLGLGLLADACHGAESALAEGFSLATSLAPIVARWNALLTLKDSLLGSRSRDCIEVERSALERLVARVNAGAPDHEVKRELVRWTREPLDGSLRRLGSHAAAIAERLEKAPPELMVSDLGVLVDPLLAQPFLAVLIHLIRNAVDHGFETPPERSAHGKPPRNQLRLEARLEQNQVLLEIADDGRGIDWQRLRALAERSGLPHDTHEQLIAALGSAGLSTKGEVTTTSGRGVGLWTALSEVERLGGVWQVESERDRGCVWKLRIPAAALGALAAHAEELRAPRSQPPVSHVSTG